jgi:radical SAM protein with 4Fe4S-binding SPASM domain
LIIKPTEKCNFKCTFCSSTQISDDVTDIVELTDIRRFLERYPETNTIIVNGGDPLMMPIEYYWDLIAILDELEMDTSISFTSNLWPFYKNPKKWAPLFNHPRMGITTSFQYGAGRLKGDYTPFTEKEFWAVSDTMLEWVGYRPDFISVIDESSRDTAIDNVRLAKKMGVECKLNYAVASGPIKQTKIGTMGNADSHYLLADAYEMYLEVFQLGLTEWEYNTKQMANVLGSQNVTCPLLRDCDTGIRSMQPSGDYYSCGSFGDDSEYPINFEAEMSGDFHRPLLVPELESMKQACYSCPMFRICNGCKKTIRDTKKSGRVESHCFKMKQLAPALLELNGLSGLMEPTPYVNESSDDTKIIAIG